MSEASTLSYVLVEEAERSVQEAEVKWILPNDNSQDPQSTGQRSLILMVHCHIEVKT